MEVQKSNELRSTGYRCLFEGIKEEGIEPFLGLVQDIQNISRKELLIGQTLFSSTNDLAILKKNHRDILKYFKSHKKELICLNITDLNLLKTLNSLSNNPSLLNLYLENARKLEALRINNIQFESFWSFNKGNCEIYRNDQGKIINITKYYTDGQIESGEEILENSFCNYNYSKIYFSIHDESFILRAQNTDKFLQFWDIYIKNFEFDSTKLPTIQELQSYEVPEEYTRKKTK